MFPNGVIYYYFSDSYVFRWQTGREAAHMIRPLCPTADCKPGAGRGEQC